MAGHEVTARPDERAGRMIRRIALLVAAGIAVATFIDLLLLQGSTEAGAFGVDYRIYMDAARRWLANGGWYLPEQLAGPYTIGIPDVLDPPTLLWLLVPFSFLPALAWWAVPVGLFALALRRLSLGFWGWLALAILLAWPYSQMEFVKGNPVIWLVALAMLGIAYGWGGAFILLKPSLFPFALLGIRGRPWWLVVGLLALLSVPFLPVMLEYPAVILNSRGGGVLYSLGDVPMMLIPLVGWAARIREGKVLAEGTFTLVK